MAGSGSKKNAQQELSYWDLDPEGDDLMDDDPFDNDSVSLNRTYSKAGGNSRRPGAGSGGGSRAAILILCVLLAILAVGGAFLLHRARQARPVGYETLCARAANTVGLRADGTVVAAGDNTFGQCEVSGWVLKVPK